MLGYSCVYCECICEEWELIVICCVGLQLCLLWVYMWRVKINCNLLCWATAVFIVIVFVKNEIWMYFVVLGYSCVNCECICEEWELIVICCVGIQLGLKWENFCRVRKDCSLLHWFTCVFIVSVYVKSGKFCN